MDKPNGRLGLRFAVAKAGDTRNAGVESAAPATLGGDSDPCANLATELDFAERQSIAIQEFRHLVGGSQGFLLGASQSRQRLRQFRFVYTRIVACPRLPVQVMFASSRRARPAGDKAPPQPSGVQAS